MSKKHLVKIGFLALIIVGVTAFSLAWVTDSAWPGARWRRTWE
jgi:hypothetical protein